MKRPNYTVIFSNSLEAHYRQLKSICKHLHYLNFQTVYSQINRTGFYEDEYIFIKPFRFVDDQFRSFMVAGNGCTCEVQPCWGLSVGNYGCICASAVFPAGFFLFFYFFSLSYPLSIWGFFQFISVLFNIFVL